jgi:hypothetical protein
LKATPGATIIPSAMPSSRPLPASLGSLRLDRLGSATLERLTRAPEEGGRVHSVFDKAINVLWSDGRLLTLHGPTPLAAPFAVALAELPQRGPVVPGLPIRRSDFDLSKADSVALEMPRGPLAFIPDALPEPPCARALRSGAGLGARQALERGMAAGDLVTLAKAASDLIGFGEGLTPAGDDCVLGALAAIHRLAPEWLTSDRSLLHRLAEAAQSRTTDVARDFLLEALAGRFAEPVLAVLTASSAGLAEHAARKLLAMGATSGADTLCGIRLGCRALETRIVSR